VKKSKGKDSICPLFLGFEEKAIPHPPSCGWPEGTLFPPSKRLFEILYHFTWYNPRAPFGARARSFTRHSALSDCGVHAVPTLPYWVVDDTVVPFMNQAPTLPLVSSQRISLLPSPL
jgi:hypothetical protein